MQVQIKKYVSDALEVKNLRSICRAWVAEENYLSFDATLSLLSQRGSFLFYAQAEGGAEDWLGIVMGNINMDVCEVYYVYVVAAARRLGLAANLLGNVITFTKANHAQAQIFLEVKAPNMAAIKLYEKLGFAMFGRRKQYYSTGEDALLYRYQA